MECEKYQVVCEKNLKSLKAGTLNTILPNYLKKALSDASWDHILSMDDPDLMTEKWLDQFTEILDQIAPFRQRKVKNSYAPFIDKEVRQKMLLRDLHKKKHTKYKDPKDWLKYKQLRNEVNFEINVKKKSYFSQKLQESKGDIKETWEV